MIDYCVDGYTVMHEAADGSLEPRIVPAKMWNRVVKYANRGTMKGTAYITLKLIDAGLDENCTDDEIRNALRKGDETEMTEMETGKVKLHFEHVLVRGERMYKFSFENVKAYDELPVEYVYGTPRMYVSRNGLLKYTDEDSSVVHTAEDGAVYTLDTVKFMSRVAKASAERLKEINKRIRDDEESWVGVVEIVVV